MKGGIMDYSKLRGRIVEKFGTLNNFATALDITKASLSSKINNKRRWTNKEILDSKRLLELETIDEYFFNM